MKKKPAKTDIVTVTKTQDMLGLSETLSDIRSPIEAVRMHVSTTANVEMELLGDRIMKDILGMYVLITGNRLFRRLEY